MQTCPERGQGKDQIQQGRGRAKAGQVRRESGQRDSAWQRKGRGHPYEARSPVQCTKQWRSGRRDGRQVQCCSSRGPASLPPLPLPPLGDTYPAWRVLCHATRPDKVERLDQGLGVGVADPQGAPAEHQVQAGDQGVEERGRGGLRRAARRRQAVHEHPKTLAVLPEVAGQQAGQQRPGRGAGGRGEAGRGQLRQDRGRCSAAEAGVGQQRQHARFPPGGDLICPPHFDATVARSCSSCSTSSGLGSSHLAGILANRIRRARSSFLLQGGFGGFLVASG